MHGLPHRSDGRQNSIHTVWNYLMKCDRVLLGSSRQQTSSKLEGYGDVDCRHTKCRASGLVMLSRSFSCFPNNPEHIHIIITPQSLWSSALVNNDGGMLLKKRQLSRNGRDQC